MSDPSTLHSPTVTEVWLLRHPEPERHMIHCCYGALDVKLSDAGIAHAHAIAEAMDAHRLDAIYSSSSQRCTQAAHILAARRSMNVQTLDALQEMNFGELEGRSHEEIAELYPDLYQQWMERPTEARFPGGESFGEMHARVTRAAAMLRARHAGQSIGLVTHAGPIRILLAEALEMPPGNIFRIAQSYGATNRIRYFGGSSVVELVNGTVFSNF